MPFRNRKLGDPGRQTGDPVLGYQLWPMARTVLPPIYTQKYALDRRGDIIVISASAVSLSTAVTPIQGIPGERRLHSRRVHAIRPNVGSLLTFLWPKLSQFCDKKSHSAACNLYLLDRVHILIGTKEGDSS